MTCKCGSTFRAQLGGTELQQNRAAPMLVEVNEVVPLEADQPVAPPKRQPIASNLPPRTRRAAHDMAAETEDLGPFRDWWLPVGLLVIGAIARFSQVLIYSDEQKLTRAKAMVLWMCELILGGAAMPGGALAAAMIFSVTFGPPGRAILKLLALWLTAAAVGCFLAKLDADPMNVRGMVLAVHAVLLIYFSGISTLFKLDLQEALLTAGICTVVQGLLLFGVAQSISPDAARALFFG
jgi:hypothetical protein